MKHSAAIALGSNLASAFGPPEANLREAIARITELGELRAVSRFYETIPVGFTEQPDFINAALLLMTALEPVNLMRALLEIEFAMGRDRTHTPSKGPRIIDLDLLLMGDRVVTAPELSLPHPAMMERRFVLEPLAEIAPEMIHPVANCTISELLARLG
jgi:2-amino-4-hydroxy-6-hydroxymethyldihydropteridine diphosphokinase